MGATEGELEGVVGALGRLVGQPLTNVWQPARDRVILGLGAEFLLMVPRGPHARLHTVPARPPNPGRPFSFQGACRARLVGPLDEIRKAAGERVVDLRFGSERLHLRLTGRSGGLWLLTGDRVLAAYDGPAPSALPALPSGGPPPRPARFLPQRGEDWDLAARRYFAAAEASTRLLERRRVVARALRAQLGRTRRLLGHLEADLQRAADAPRMRREADALAASLHLVRRGQEQVVLPDLDDPDLLLRIALDPAAPPSATLERLYDKARRLDRIGERVVERIDETERRLLQLEEALEEVEEADPAALDRLEGLAPPPRAAASGRSDAVPWRTWRGPHGERVLVGRDAKANRRLTFQVARGDDWWMHLRGRPGAHLVLPMDRGATPTLEHLLAAAQIALLEGGVPTGAAADVQYTRARNVRAIPGERAGRVLVADERVLRVTRDPDALSGWSREDRTS